MAIIEKIKKIKQNGECADLPCYVPLSVANFLFKKKKKKKRKKKNICSKMQHRRCQICVAPS